MGYERIKYAIKHRIHNILCTFNHFLDDIYGLSYQYDLRFEKILSLKKIDKQHHYWEIIWSNKKNGMPSIFNIC